MGGAASIRKVNLRCLVLRIVARPEILARIEARLARPVCVKRIVSASSSSLQYRGQRESIS
jgi:hypothetical protein